MGNESYSRMYVLVERLRVVDKSLNRLTAERLAILGEIAKLDAEGGASGRQTASRVARVSASSPKQAAGELAMAKQLSVLPGIADAHAKGEISNGQLGAVAAIASATSENEALALAKVATSSQLEQRAAASRGQLFEQRRTAQTGRYLAFKPEEGGQSTRIHGRLPFAESKQLETQLRKIADRLNLGDKERPSPSARMADALLILTKNNPSQALHNHEQRVGNSATQTSGASSQEPVTEQPVDESRAPQASTTNTSNTSANGTPTPTDGAARGFGTVSPIRQKLCAPTATPSQRINSEQGTDTSGSGRVLSNPVIDYDEDPFPEIGENDQSHSTVYGDDCDDCDQPLTAIGVTVQRADTRLIIHWNAQTGAINFENGPPVDHPRLQAILCDAQIDVQHCDADGLPTGLITTAHHSSWRQDRYLAFRDGPCRIPECEGIGKTQAHHIFEDRIDRLTSVEYMINLCSRDHQEHHDGKFAITGKPEQTVTFTYNDGSVLRSTARPSTGGPNTPKPIPLSKHRTTDDNVDLFAASA
jgi:Domain of unknown function (DUF222)